MYCCSCGGAINPKWRYCKHCGASLLDELQYIPDNFPYVPTTENISTHFEVYCQRGIELQDGEILEIPISDVKKYKYFNYRNSKEEFLFYRECIKQKLYNHFYICPKELCNKSGRGTILYTPEYLRNISEFTTTNDGIYYIQNNILYYLDISGNRVKIQEGMEDCISLRGRVLHKNNQRITELQCVFFDGISTETLVENNRKIREFVRAERLKFFSKLSKKAENSNPVITLRIRTKKRIITI